MKSGKRKKTADTASIHSTPTRPSSRQIFGTLDTMPNGLHRLIREPLEDVHLVHMPAELEESMERMSQIAKGRGVVPLELKVYPGT
jgi:hypothetical protein